MKVGSLWLVDSGALCITVFVYTSQAVLIILPVLIAIAFFTLAERKIMASVQRRRGPNVVGVFGLLQPFADGLKALVKEVVVPYQSGKFLFFLAPSLSFIVSLLSWGLIPFSYTDVVADINYGLLYIYALSSLSVYGIVLAGWASKSKYPFLGAIRSSAQMISYEVAIGLVFVIIGFVSHSLNLIDIVYVQDTGVWNVFLLWPVAIVFLISIIAETNRAPFDLPEAEAEIVAGYNLEYSSIVFAFFFLGEYGNIFLMCNLYVILFLGGWSPVLPCIVGSFTPVIWLQVKAGILCFFFVLVRAALPRYRYDQLMDILWKVFLPYTILYLIILAIYFFFLV